MSTLRPSVDAAQVARWIAEFDASGIHRVGAPGDFASGAWLEREAAVDGVTVSRMAVPLQHMVIDDAHIECASLRIDGLPMFDSPPIATLTGALGTDIGYAEFAPNAASIKGQPLEQWRRTTAQKALIVATRVTGESLAPINAQYYNQPFGPPVLLVAGMHHTFLAEQAAQHAPVRFVSAHHRVSSASFNVTAVTAADTGEPPIAIVTPRTGWWESTAERAGGLVAWLAGVHAAAALAGRGGLRRGVHAWATCGHELGHLGLQTLTQHAAPLITRAKYWLHLGANLGSAGNPAMMIRAADSADAQAMRELLVAEGYPAQHIAVEPIGKISGEGHDLTHLGARVLSLAGTNQHFHAASDRWPGNIHTAGIASIARAVARWVTQQAG